MIKRLLIVIGIVLGIVFIPYYTQMLLPNSFIGTNTNILFLWLAGLMLIFVFSLLIGIIWILLEQLYGLIEWIKTGK